MIPDSDKTHSGVVRFWRDESGFISTVDYLVLISVVAIGSIVGLTEVRTSLVQIMGDVAGSLENLNQSYSFSVIGSTSIYIDTATSADTAGVAPQGISVQQPPTAGG
jgi:Flp pilus assembly pilin Flp